jgi:DNA-directed RNA polymerase I subunit RPA2
MFKYCIYIIKIGIRLGEMERDGLLAHGISYALHDRLMNCSDYSEVILLNILVNYYYINVYIFATIRV